VGEGLGKRGIRTYLAPLVLLCFLSACAGLSPRPGPPGSPSVHLENVPFERQKPGHCGPAALSSLLSYCGIEGGQEEIGREIYNPRLKGVLGYDLWRVARRKGLVSLEIHGGDAALMESLLVQGVPVLLNLDLGFGAASIQHYVLVIGRDAERRRWIAHDGRRAGRRVKEKWLAKRWEKAGGWALVAFPPERIVKGLPPDVHVQAAAQLPDEPARALDHLEEASAGRPADAALWLRIGTLRHTLGRQNDAEAAYRESLRLDSRPPDAYNNLAFLLSEDKNRLAEAEALAREAVKRSAGLPADDLRRAHCFDTLAQILLRRGKKSEARKIFQSALSILPADQPLRADIQSRLKLE
jgi:hypothetical protein